MSVLSNLARCVYARRVLFMVVALLLTCAGVIAQSSSSPVDESITFLRQIDPAKVKPDDEESIAKKIDAAWKKNHRLELASSELPLDTRQLLSGATVDDVPLLLEVKAAVLARLSDECLYEVKSISSVIQRVGRSRYRRD